MSDVTTVVVQVGNSDDKLSQERWSFLVDEVAHIVKRDAEAIHFFGLSPGDAPWQNACWVAEVSEARIPELRQALRVCAWDYGQDSVAWLEGSTEFLSATTPEGWRP